MGNLYISLGKTRDTSSRSWNIQLKEEIHKQGGRERKMKGLKNGPLVIMQKMKAIDSQIRVKVR